MIDRAAFFASVRPGLFGGRLTQAQVTGLDAILDAAPAAMPVEHMAYCLATAFHETGRTMEPVVENLTYTSAERIRQVWPSRFPTTAAAVPLVRNPRGLANTVYGGRMGNAGTDDGWIFRGRGYVQITGRDNYKRAGEKTGRDLIAFPDDAMRPDVAAEIMFNGMGAGWFTGRKLSEFFGPGREDAVGARRIINGLDEAERIARYYVAFRKALRAAARPAPAPKVAVVTPGGRIPADPPAKSLGARLRSFFAPRLPTQHLLLIPQEKPVMAAPFLPSILANIAGAVATALVQNPAVPVEQRDATVVRREVAMQLQTELAPRLEHLTNNEPWYQSRVTIGALVSGLAGLASGFGFALAPEDVDVIVGGATAAGTVVGAAITLYGRWKARKPLGA